MVINPNNPTGAVYPRELLEELVAIAEEHGLVLLSDEIYGNMTYGDAEFIPLATIAKDTLSLSLSLRDLLRPVKNLPRLRFARRLAILLR